ncbi:MAG: mechanosensitive ion channel family protein [Eubacteriales bacterium]|nr:mechanosensitive ion channel family protein [Eubacteriales bacterium]
MDEKTLQAMDETVEAVVQEVVSESFLDWLDAFSKAWYGQIALTLLFVAVIVLVTAALVRTVNRFFKRKVDKMTARGDPSAAAFSYLRYLAVGGLYFAAFAVVVSNIPPLAAGMNKLMAAGGVLAVVGGLAAQEALGSIVSGMMILAFKPFQIGDVVRYIENDVSGVIEEITLHHTVIRTWENKRVIVPNAQMNSSIVENADYADSKVCTFLEINIGYDADIARAKALLAQEIARHPDYLDMRTPEQKAAGDPAVTVLVLGLTERSVTLRASIWAKDNGTAFGLKCDVQESIKAIYEREGIRPAYPHVVFLQK